MKPSSKRALLKTDDIQIDGGTQQREKINDDIVEEYAEAMRCGAKFPPVTVFFDGVRHWLADGFHRWHATRAVPAPEIDVDIYTGTRRDAVLYSTGSNGDHGIRPTNADKRKAVGIMLADKEWSAWSDRDIAKHCRVTHPLVSKIRSEIISSAAPKVVTVTTQQKNPIEHNGIDDPLVTVTTHPQAPPDDPQQSEVDALREWGEQNAQNARELLAENESLAKAFEADDKAASLAADNKQLRAQVEVMTFRIRGLMNEVEEAKKAAKSWQRKCEKLEKAAKECA